MTQNANPNTGVRYGVIACKSLNQDLVDTLFYGSQATNVSEEEVAAEAETALREQYWDLVDQSHLAAEESGADREVGFDSEAFEEAWFEKHEYRYDEEDFVERGLESGAVDFQIEEPTITGTYEGVEYMISWLGGAPLLFVFQSPHTTHALECSPCIPNAGSLESKDPEGVLCYDVPDEWRFVDGGSS